MRRESSSGGRRDPGKRRGGKRREGKRREGGDRCRFSTLSLEGKRSMGIHNPTIKHKPTSISTKTSLSSLTSIFQRGNHQSSSSGNGSSFSVCWPSIYLESSGFLSRDVQLSVRRRSSLWQCLVGFCSDTVRFF
ncbi:hypothetical protein AXX17_AT4G04510 [Arabidopsis thaliana]|uniref:Uncharacterized protein n=1 Tax=Arabidopsis thaliana TaxID=3702 RepID=A0A178UX32_ARATH|nr:hypothetical protein AXX17_AT4G04510 [Arabidopsis thaliana]